MIPPVFSFVAFSNTGKTTYLEKLIPCLKTAGLRIAVLKHDAHNFSLDTEEKDTWRAARAGADVVAIASDCRFAYFQQSKVLLENILDHLPDVDIVLLEGFKDYVCPKIAVFRKESGKPIAIDLSECFAIVSDTPFEADCPVFPLNDPQPLTEYLLQNIQRNNLTKEEMGL